MGSLGTWHSAIAESIASSAACPKDSNSNVIPKNQTENTSESESREIS